MKNIAIITARSGSKGLRDKNIKLLAGRPLMAYTIEAAIKSGMFEEIMVSTDSEEYAEIARENGAEVPFLRGVRNSADTASSWDAVEEVLAGYRSMGREFTSFCLMQPTSPLRTAEDVISAYRIFEENSAVSVVAMCEVEHPVEWCGVLGEKNSLNGFVDRECIRSRQSFRKHYRPNGSIYIADIKGYEKDKFLYREGSYAYVMPTERSIDIDTEIDFILAELLLNRGGDGRL